MAEARSPWQTATELDIVPTPQQITRYNQEFALSGWRVTFAAGSMLSQTGAREINDHIATLGGNKLPVGNGLSRGHNIVIAPCTHPLAKPFLRAVEVTSKNPGEQGYVIKVVTQGNRHLLLAIGSDELGTLYACETVRNLIQTRQGQPVLLHATVRDWPAFKKRCLGMIDNFGGGPGVGDYLAEARPVVQWLARHKINYAVLRPGAFGPADRRAKALTEVGTLAAEYGVQLRSTFSTAINKQLSEANWTNCVERKGSKFCWSAFDEHKAAAATVAQFAAETKLDYFCLHAVDAGGMLDPETWSKRCPRCHQAYGDDHTRAAAEQFYAYYRAIKEASPATDFEAVVYPYHFQWAVPGFPDGKAGAEARAISPGWIGVLPSASETENIVTKLQEHHAALARLLPKDVFVTFREAGRDEFEAVCRLWKGHPIDIWVYYSRNHGWRGLWEPQQRFTKTWYRDKSSDMLFHAGLGYAGNVSEVRAAACAEYAWNLEVPDAAADFSVRDRFYEVQGRNVTAFQVESLIPRVLRRMWGQEWESFRDLYERNISFAYIADPLGVSSTAHDAEAFTDPYAFLSEQTEALKLAVSKLADLVRRIDEGECCEEKLQPGTLGYRHALYLYQMVHLAWAKARVELAKVRAERLGEQGDRPQAVSLLESLLEEWSVLEDGVQKANERVLSDKHLPRYRTLAGDQRTDSKLYGYSLSEQRSLIQRRITELKQKPLPLPDGIHGELKEVGRREDTVTYGFATQLSLLPVITSGAACHDVLVTVEVQHNRSPLAQWQEQVPDLQGVWKSANSVNFDLGLAYEGELLVVVRVEGNGKGLPFQFHRTV